MPVTNNHTLLETLYKPIPIVFNNTLGLIQNYTNSFIAVAGTDIDIDSKVYLLYEIPISLLARRFNCFTGKNDNKLNILVHELNGCLVGPGLYQEWTYYINAAKDKSEQNLELCRSLSNNMLYYKVIKRIKKGDQLLAWYNPNVELELSRSLLNRDYINPNNNSNNKSSNKLDEALCKRCLINYEYPNILKSHLLFDLCGKSFLNVNSNEISNNSLESSSISSSELLNNKNNKTNNNNNNNNNASTPPPLSSASSTSSTSSSLSNQINKHHYQHKLFSNKHSHHNFSSDSRSSAFSPIINNKSLVKTELISSSSRSSSTSPSHSPNENNNNNRNSNISIKKQQSNNDSSSSSSTSSKVSKECLINNKTSSKNLNNLNSTNQPTTSNGGQNGIDWKITMLDGTQTVELNMADEMGKHKKTHVCLFCGKIYNRKYGLKIHLRTHTGYKPLKCKVCLRPFSDPSNLNKHVRLHSQGDTPYRCPYCGKILVRKRDLDRHIMCKHNGMNASSKEANSCDIQPTKSNNVSEYYGNGNEEDYSNDDNSNYLFNYNHSNNEIRMQEEPSN